MGKFFKWLVIIFGLLLVFGIVGSFVFSDKIEHKILSELRKSLKTEIRVKDFSFSLLGAFPDAVARFKNVELEDNFGGILLETKELSFKLGLVSILTDNIKVKALKVEDGAIAIVIDRHGKANYSVFKESDKKTDSSTALSFDKANFYDIEFIYENNRDENNVDLIFEKAVFSGDFSAKKFNLTSYAKLKSKFIDAKDKRFLTGKNLSYDAEIKVDLEKGIFDFNKVELAVESNVLDVDGTITGKGGVTDYDLEFEGTEGNIGDVLQLLPNEYLQQLGDLSGKGNYVFNATIRGKQDKKHTPAIKANMSLKDGKVSSKRLNGTIKGLSFQLDYSNGRSRKNAKSYFKLKNLEGYFDRAYFESDFEAVNLDNPNISFYFDGAIPVNALRGFVKSPSVTKGEGILKVKKLYIKGKYKDLSSPRRIARAKASGSLTFDDAGLVINGERMILDRGSLTLRNNNLKIEDVKIEGGNSDLFFNGNVQNLLPVLFSDSLNTKRAMLKFDVKMRAPKADLAKLVHLTDISVEKGEVKKETYDSLKVAGTKKRERITNLLDGKVDITLDEFSYNKIEGLDFNGSFTFADGGMRIKGDAEGFDGDFDVDGKMVFGDNTTLKALVETRDVNIKKLFAQAENFGQDVLKARHISGHLNSNFVVSAYWDADGSFRLDRLRVLAGIGLEDGEIKDFDLFTNFSDFIKIDDLRRVKFDNLENWLEIKNEKIYIPTMFIRSNALNLTMTGVHSFKNTIQYYLKINAGQVLINKLKRHDSSLRPLEDRRKGLFNLFYKLYGKTANVKYKTARRDAKKALLNGEHRAREIRAGLLKEFGNLQLVEKAKALPVANDNNRDIPEEEEEEEYIEGF